MENSFFQDFKKNLIGQYEESKGYKTICKNYGYNPYTDLKYEDDIEKVPFIATTLFKRSNNLFISLLRTEVKSLDKWTLSSSTSGDPSIVGRCASDIEKLRELVKKDEDVFRNKRDYECVFFPKADEMKAFKRSNILGKPAESYIGNILDLFTYRDDTVVLLKLQDNEFKLDTTSFINYLEEHDKKERFAAVGGSTPLIYNTIQRVKQKMKPVVLGSNAILHTGGGGWDGRKGNINIGTEIERWKFVHDVSDFLGIPPENFTDTYSFTENSFTVTGHYSKEYKDYLFHIPPWAKVIIRDEKTLKPVTREGERGLVQVLNAYGTSGFAGASILVDDIAEMVSEKRCPVCGHAGMTIKIIGRVKGTEAKGCGAAIATGGDMK